MTERKREILQTAVEMIAVGGYSSLTMRALARACGIKLGTLQFHFRTSDELLRAVVDYIAAAYRSSFSPLLDRKSPPELSEIVDFVLDDAAGAALSGDRLWPQLWAMQQVEPLVSDLLEDVYASYLEILEQSLARAGSLSPRDEALALISMLEGSTIFLGHGRRWSAHAESVRGWVQQLVYERYGGRS